MFRNHAKLFWICVFIGGLLRNPLIYPVGEILRMCVFKTYQEFGEPGWI